MRYARTLVCAAVVALMLSACGNPPVETEAMVPVLPSYQGQTYCPTVLPDIPEACDAAAQVDPAYGKATQMVIPAKPVDDEGGFGIVDTDSAKEQVSEHAAVFFDTWYATEQYRTNFVPASHQAAFTAQLAVLRTAYADEIASAKADGVDQKFVVLVGGKKSVVTHDKIAWNKSKVTRPTSKAVPPNSGATNKAPAVTSSKSATSKPRTTRTSTSR